MASLFNIGINGLQAQQTALNVTGQNITNASTPGYSRQRAEITSLAAANSSGGFSGSGARVDAITRIADEFISNQIRIDQSLHSELESFGTRIGQLERSLFDEGFGLDSAMRDFFDAVNAATSNPLDNSSRQFMIAAGESMALRFQGVAGRLAQQRVDVTASMTASTEKINQLAGLIAEVNLRIATQQNGESTGSLNFAIDQRDELLKELAAQVSVTTSEQADGQISVFIGKGQSLVLGTQVSKLGVSAQGGITFQPLGSPSTQDITAAISGGELGGLLGYFQQVLSPTQNEIGHLAASVSHAFNAQHRLGVDENGDFGLDFFRNLNDPSIVGQRFATLQTDSVAGVGTVNVYIEDPLAYAPADYELRVLAGGDFTITRSHDKEIVFQGASIVVPMSAEFEGLRVEFANGEFNPGQTMLIRPYAAVGEGMSIVLSDPASLALASPVVIDAAQSNTGSAQARVASITDPSNPIFGGDNSLLPPLLVRFVNDNQYQVLDNSDPGNPRPLVPGLGLQDYIPGTQNHMLPYRAGSSVVHSDGPLVGDLSQAPSLVSNLSLPVNNYPAGIVTAELTDPNTNQTVVQSVAIAAGSSAREIAQVMSGMAGVQASASTKAYLSNLVNLDSGIPVELAVNGQLVTGFLNINELADAINANSTLTGAGIIARSDGQILELTSLHGDDLTIHFQGDPNEEITVANNNGQSQILNGNMAGTYRRVSISGELTAIMEPDITLSAQLTGVLAVRPIHENAEFGVDILMSGSAAAGDEFSITSNQSTRGDNRNALALSLLADGDIVGDPPKTFTRVFSGLIQEIGIASSQTNVNRQAAQNLLEQSESYRESISGVNLDEEAANLIRFEQAYNASAQVISIARDIFNVLLNAVA